MLLAVSTHLSLTHCLYSDLTVTPFSMEKLSLCTGEGVVYQSATIKVALAKSKYGESIP